MPPDPSAGTTGYALNLAIWFERGMGVTHRVSAAEVSFRTGAKLAVGERLRGSLRLPPADDAPGTVVRYEALVVAVEPAAAHGLREVKARFDALSLRPERSDAGPDLSAARAGRSSRAPSGSSCSACRRSDADGS